MAEQKILIVAGEASGDLHAAHLARELMQRDPALKIQGMGGEKMRNAGVELLIDASGLAVIGLIEVLARYRSIKKALQQLKQQLRQSPPDLLILVDYQEFNQKLAAFAKSLGIKVLFYIGPTVWAWRPKRVYKMARIVDHLAVILPFEVDYYKDTGLAVTFTGHPLIDIVKPDKSRQQARQHLDLEDKTTVGLLPGSRSGEIRRILPILLQTAQRLNDRRSDLHYVLSLASSLDNSDLEPYRTQLQQLQVTVIRDRSYDVIQACDVVASASGTATLETGLLGVPMVIVYKVAPLSYFILSRLVKVKHIGLVNIIPGKEIVREFVQNDARAEPIAEEILRILDDPNYNQQIRNELSRLSGILGGEGGYSKVADLAYMMLQQ